MTKEIKDFKNNLSTKTYHKRHKKSANKTLKAIELVNGKTDPNLIKLSNEYTSDVLGWIGFAPWLHVYCSVA